MKLILAIVHDPDHDTISKALILRGFRVTRIALHGRLLPPRLQHAAGGRG